MCYRPDDVYRLSEEGEGGKFTYKTKDEQVLVEGTYRIEWASLAGKQKKAFVFTYKGENDVEKQHTFFNFSPYLGTQSLTRERGPITTAWLEDVSDSPYLEDVLPADRTVVYWVDTMIFSLSAGGFVIIWYGLYCKARIRTSVVFSFFNPSFTLLISVSP